MIYEYERDMEDTYMQYLMKSYKKTIVDGLFDFIIVDSINSTLRHYTEFYNFAKTYAFTVSSTHFWTVKIFDQRFFFSSAIHM